MYIHTCTYVQTLIQGTIYAKENADVVCIPVLRTGGTFSTIGTEFTTNDVSASGNGVDYNPDSGLLNLHLETYHHVLILIVLMILILKWMR